MYRAVSHDIEVTVVPEFLPDESEPGDSRYVWAYTIGITNRGREAVRLRTRHWRITDAAGHLQEVRGRGVVGVEPRLGPGERFEYTSACPLSTSSGMMVGSYEMETADGRALTVAIPAFSLDLPGERRVMN